MQAGQHKGLARHDCDPLEPGAAKAKGHQGDREAAPGSWCYGTACSALSNQTRCHTHHALSCSLVTAGDMTAACKVAVAGSGMGNFLASSPVNQFFFSIALSWPQSDALQTAPEGGPTPQASHFPSLLQFLQGEGLYESAQESLQREEVLGQLNDLVREWVKQVARVLAYDEDAIEAANGRIFTFGSYRLGVHGPGGTRNDLGTVPADLYLYDPTEELCHDLAQLCLCVLLPPPAAQPRCVS